jgi:cysteine dioxygenase
MITVDERLTWHLVYTPPNAAMYGCNVFSETTGKESHVTQSNFYSVHGKRVGSFQTMI